MSLNAPAVAGMEPSESAPCTRYFEERIIHAMRNLPSTWKQFLNGDPR